MRLELLKQLLAVPSYPRKEERMVAFIAEHVRQRGVERCGQIVSDQLNNIYIRKGNPGIVPVVAAHLDTVHELGFVEILKQQDCLFGVNENGVQTGIGADDKAGVFVCLELLERFEHIAVVLFAGEEIGCVGAQNAPEKWFEDAGYVIEFDCPGQGLVSYTSGGVRLFANDGEFIKTAGPVMQAHGLTRWQDHPFSDVKALRHRFNLSCLNLSCGYHNWHRRDEFLALAEVSAAIEAGEALIKALGNQSYAFDAEAEDKAAPLYAVSDLSVATPPIALNNGRPKPPTQAAKFAPRQEGNSLDTNLQTAASDDRNKNT